MNTLPENNLDFEWEMRNDFLVLRVKARRATVDMAPDLKERLFSEIEKGKGIGETDTEVVNHLGRLLNLRGG